MFQRLPEQCQGAARTQDAASPSSPGRGPGGQQSPARSKAVPCGTLALTGSGQMTGAQTQGKRSVSCRPSGEDVWSSTQPHHPLAGPLRGKFSLCPDHGPLGPSYTLSIFFKFCDLPTPPSLFFHPLLNLLRACCSLVPPSSRNLPIQ